MPEKKVSQVVPNRLLRTARLERGWTQQEVAELIGATQSFLVNRWERGVAFPSLHYRQRLCELFGKSMAELGLLAQEPAAKDLKDRTPLFDPAIPLPYISGRKLIGRNEQLEFLRQRIWQPGTRSALYGLPGVGKTALAVALASMQEVQAYFQDGILWARSGPDGSVVSELRRWGMFLGMQGDQIEHYRTNEAWADALRNLIGRRKMLLIIDDAWSIEAVQGLMVGGGSCAYILTTRFSDIATSFAGENALRVQELSNAEGVELLKLFAEHVVEAESEEARVLVQAVGGLPLALTLMGSYLAVEGCNQQRRRIQGALTRLLQAEERLKLALPSLGLAYQNNAARTHMLSLQAVIEVSDHFLDADAQFALRALACCAAKPATFSEEAALAITGKKIEVIDILVDAGLLESVGKGRYTLHQTIADYARLEQIDADVEMRFIHYFINHMMAHSREYALLEEEIANIYRALHYASLRGCHEIVLQGTEAFIPFLETRGLYTLAEQLLARAYSVALARGCMEHQMKLLFSQGKIAGKQGRYKEAERLLQRSFEIAQKIGAYECMSTVLAHRGEVVLNRGDYRRAELYLREGLLYARKHGDKQRVSLLLKNLGEVVDGAGDYEQGKAFYTEGLALAMEAGDLETASALLQNLGVNAERHGNYAEAERLYQEGLDIASKMGHRQRMSALLMNLGMVALRDARYPLAEQYSLESLEIAREIGLRQRISSVLQNLSMLERHRHNYTQAESYIQESLELAREMGHEWLIAEALIELGELYLVQNRYEEAETVMTEALLRAQQMQGQELIAYALYGCARIDVFQENYALAQSRGQESRDIFAAMGHEYSDKVATWLASIPVSS